MLPDAYFERFHTPKYQSKNPVQRALIRRFVRALHGLFVEAGPVKSVVEVGVGEGFLSGFLSERFVDVSFTGVDPAERDLEGLRAKFPRIDARVGTVEDLSGLSPPYDLVLCCEVLEHVADPERALDSLLSLGGSRYLLTVPHEPFFMLSNLARLKNIARLGNDPEHVNHWGKASFRRLCETRFEVLSFETSYPWILALLTPKRRA